jgi:hypothetical protein
MTKTWQEVAALLPQHIGKELCMISYFWERSGSSQSVKIVKVDESGERILIQNNRPENEHLISFASCKFEIGVGGRLDLTARKITGETLQLFEDPRPK